MNELMRTILMLPPQASTMAREIDLLHYFVISITMLGATAVGMFCLIFLIRYRRSAHRGRDQAPDSRRFHTRGGLPVWFEVVAIGGLFSLFLMWWVLGYRQYVALQDPPENAAEIYVTGKKWMWSFAYPEGGGSNGVLYVPVDRPIKLIITSRDVIHSFYVPAFRIKQDAVPGRVTTAWFEANEPGTYHLFCAEYCGTGHSLMRGQVIVLSEIDYARRMENMTPPRESADRYQVSRVTGRADTGAPGMAEMGQVAAAEHGCLRCHTVDGTPHIGPTWARLYGSEIRTQTGERLRVDEAYITESMMDPLLVIRQGFPPVMPSYHGVLTAGETGAIVEYIRSLASVAPGEGIEPLPQEPAVELPVEVPPTVPREDDELPIEAPRPLDEPGEPPRPGAIPGGAQSGERGNGSDR